MVKKKKIEVSANSFVLSLSNCKDFPNYLERDEGNKLNVTLNSLQRAECSASNTHTQTCTDVLTFGKKHTDTKISESELKG